MRILRWLIVALIILLLLASSVFGQCGSAGHLVLNPITSLLDCTAVVGAGTGSVTSLTATAPIVITPSPTTTVGVVSCPSCLAAVAGSQYSVQVNNGSAALGGNTGFLYSTATGYASLGNLGALGGGPILAADFGGTAVLDFEQNWTGNCDNYCMGQANYFQIDDGDSPAYAIGTTIAAFTKAGTTRSLGQMVGLNVESQSYGGTVTDINGVNIYAQNRTTTNVSHLVGNYINIANVSSGDVALAYGFVATTVENRSTGHITTYVPFYTEAQGGVTGITNAYDFWADEQGVYRIKADNTFDSVYQAIPALYNPQFTKYTPGAANYERIVEQWNGNKAEIGTEKGGTGTLRVLKFIGASVELPGSSFTFDGKTCTVVSTVLTCI